MPLRREGRRRWSGCLGNLLKARLSRRIAFWIFVNFLVVEGIVLVPSVLRQADRLGDQVRAVTDAKIEWLVENDPAASPAERLEAVARLASPGMVQGIEGAALYRAATGERLGGFGQAPRLSLARAAARLSAAQDSRSGRWFPLAASFEGVWGPRQLGDDLLLVVRHDDGDLRRGLLEYVRNIALIVLAIAVFLTLSTMVVIERLVIGRVLQLRDRLSAAGRALAGGGAIVPADHLLPPGAADEVGEVERAFNDSFLRTHEEMERRQQAECAAREERDRAETLLLNILPAPIAAEMKSGRHTISQTHAAVSVLFADIVGFTELTGRLSCHELVTLLNRVFSAFDGLSERHGLEKIKTIGDNYMVVGGLPSPSDRHAEAIADMALEMQTLIGTFHRPDAQPMALRIGMHTGPVVAGVIGRRKFIYDLWGHTVNVASRLETGGLPGRIQMSEAMADLLRGRFGIEPRGDVAIKGVGMMSTYWLGARRA